nr:Ig-like domain repeat protein [Methanobrevibacter arboriphilus]
MTSVDFVRKFGILFLFLFFVIVSISSVSAIQVDNSSTIVETIKNNPDESVFELDGTYNSGSHDGSTNINRNITIRGSGSENKAIIKVSNTNRLFRIGDGSCNFNLENLIFENNGNLSNQLIAATYQGNGAATIKITNCTFINFTNTDSRYGVIYGVNTNTFIMDGIVFKSDFENAACAIKINSMASISNSEFIGYGISLSGDYDPSITKIDNCTFKNYKNGTLSGNAALSISGNGQLMYSFTPVIISNCIFENNTVDIIVNHGTGDPERVNILITGCSFIDNGVVLNNPSNINYNFSYCRFMNNTAVISAVVGNFTLDYNWWGSNTLPEEVAIFVNNYFVVSFANSTSFVFGENLTFNYLLRLNDSSDFDVGLLPEFYGEFSDTNVNNGSVLFSDDTFSFTGLMDKSNYNMTFIMDNEIISFVYVFVPNYTDLESSISLIEAALVNLNESEYSADSWAILLDTIALAKLMVNGSTPVNSQDDIDAQILALTDAVRGLTLNYSVLLDLIVSTDGLKESDYTADSWDKLQTAIANATAMYEGNTADSYADVIAQRNALQSAINNLVEIPSTPVNVATTFTMANHVGTYGKVVQLRATLKDVQGHAVSGHTVTFYVNGKVVGKGVTDSAGLATCNYKVSSTGTLSLRASFSGQDSYLASLKEAKLTVSKISVLKVKNIKSVKKRTVTLKTILANLGPDKTGKFRITYKLAKGFTYKKPKVSIGKLSYNKKTRTLTWTVNPLKVHKSKSATLIWTMKAKKGKYTIAPKVSKVSNMKVTSNNVLKSFRVK